MLDFSTYTSYLKTSDLALLLSRIAAKMLVKYLKALCVYLVFIRIWCRPAISYSVVTSLPGFNASLPFKLETGYIGVDDSELFYYFIESEKNPAEDPLLLWLTGGPGCTGASGLFFEIGPLRSNIVEYNGSLPTFSLNPYAWTKVSSIIFLDAPVGTGFSYSKTQQGSKTGDMKHATSCYKFLRKWLESHPKLITNPLYIAGESYSGLVVPIITQAIADDIEDMGVTVFNLKGYLLGNPLTDRKIDLNARVPYYNRMALISDELYKSAKRNCKGEYIEVEVGNKRCANDLQAISECISHIYLKHILEPVCCPSILREVDVLENNRKYLLETYENSWPSECFGCSNYNTYLLKVWTNDISVQKALQVRMGTIKEWFRCNPSLDYDNDVQSSVSYYPRLITKGYRGLIYSGDHDAGIPYLGTESWIKSLNLSIVDDWRPWFVDGQVGGYSREYENKFTFATVKGAGHTVPEYNPKESFAMFNRWISQQPL
ncbi:serine carboxypeptidase-like 2 [Hibiscus syriacus]|uniref:serine carboxypeptidase-like 2 n=1 Tax=Hibiscus syriacus TaxID=106335 RepID=UPI0019248300|nr:serine carboxypeptidase-like 2 [Hibiscus syriacus]